MTRPDLLVKIEVALSFQFEKVINIQEYFYDSKNFPDSYREVMSLEEEMVREWHNNTAFIDNEDNLVGINLGGCKLQDESIQALLKLPLPHLQALNLNRTGVRSFTFSDQQPALVHVGLNSNESLTSIRFQACPEVLESLECYDCRVEALDLPAGMDKIQKLDIARNQELNRLSFATACPELIYLDASDNKIESVYFPGSFPGLAYLFLRNNSISSFNFVGSFPLLANIDLRNNKLKEISQGFLNLRGLTHLFIHGNPIENIPAESIPSGERENAWNGIRGFLQSLAEDGEIPNDEVKLILLGNSTAGKSAIFKYLKYRKFDPNSLSTHGINNEIWEPEQLPFKVNVWDFGGQEFYHATHRLFLSNNAVNLVVFEEGTNQQAEIPTTIHLFEGGKIVSKEVDLDHFPYGYWMKNVEHFSEKAPVFCLVENKTDLKNNTGFIQPSDSEKKSFNIPPENVFNISVWKTYEHEPSYQPFFVIFEQKLKEVLEKTRATYTISPKWIEIKEAIRGLAKPQNNPTPNQEPPMFLTYDAYQDLCEGIRPGIAGEPPDPQGSMLDSLTDYLHDIGVILYYRDILPDYVFINPEEIINTIYRVLDYTVIKKEGRFDLDHVESKVGKGIDATTVLSLMRKFKLIFEPKKLANTFVAPQYLPKSFDEQTKGYPQQKNRCGQLGFTLHFPKILPRSIMTQLICTYGSLATEFYWRDEIIFETYSQQLNKNLYVRICQIPGNKISVWMEEEDDDILLDIFNTCLKLYKQNEEIEISIGGDHFIILENIHKYSEARSTKIETTQGYFLPLEPFLKFAGKKGHEVPHLRK